VSKKLLAPIIFSGLEHVATNYGVGGSNPSLRDTSTETQKLSADNAGVAELVDARDLGSRVNDVRVRVSPPV
jgi:hypothetical protein